MITDSCVELLWKTLREAIEFRKGFRILHSAFIHIVLST